MPVHALVTGLAPCYSAKLADACGPAWAWRWQLAIFLATAGAEGIAGTGLLPVRPAHFGGQAARGSLLALRDLWVPTWFPRLLASCSAWRTCISTFAC